MQPLNLNIQWFIKISFSIYSITHRNHWKKNKLKLLTHNAHPNSSNSIDTCSKALNHFRHKNKIKYININLCVPDFGIRYVKHDPCDTHVVYHYFYVVKNKIFLFNIQFLCRLLLFYSIYLFNLSVILMMI